jgi:hypothetical protein
MSCLETGLQKNLSVAGDVPQPAERVLHNVGDIQEENKRRSFL